MTGRFAPSPSGRMHLGNVFSAMLAWLSVRSRGGEMVLRIEDLDPDRCRPEYAETLKDDLRWLGLDWDREQIPQSRRTAAYAAEFEELAVSPARSDSCIGAKLAQGLLSDFKAFVETTV